MVIAHFPLTTSRYAHEDVGDDSGDRVMSCVAVESITIYTADLDPLHPETIQKLKLTLLFITYTKLICFKLGNA